MIRNHPSHHDLLDATPGSGILAVSPVSPVGYKTYLTAADDGSMALLVQVSASAVTPEVFAAIKHLSALVSVPPAPLALMP